MTTLARDGGDRKRKDPDRQDAESPAKKTASANNDKKAADRGRLAALGLAIHGLPFVPRVNSRLRPKASLNVPSLAARVRSRVGFFPCHERRKRLPPTPSDGPGSGFASSSLSATHARLGGTSPELGRFGHQQQGSPVHDRMRPKSRNAARTIDKLAGTTEQRLSLEANNPWLRGPERRERCGCQDRTL